MVDYICCRKNSIYGGTINHKCKNNNLCCNFLQKQRIYHTTIENKGVYFDFKA